MPARDTANLARQAAELRKLLAEVGPRRQALAERLGSKTRPLPIAALLARFRDAGLERELGQRERDLIRGLFSRHYGATRHVAAELGITPDELQQLVRERGLTRELEQQRTQMRAEARRKTWPRELIEQLLHRRAWLEDLGIYEEMERAVRERVEPLWEKLCAGPSALEELRRELRLRPKDVRALHKLLGQRF